MASACTRRQGPWQIPLGVSPLETVARMEKERKFARFRPKADADRMVFTVPEDGLCLSTFLLLRPRDHPDRVLLGHLNPEGPWAHIGALDARRAALWSKGWMLPSSQLVYYETPDESARRIAREQLGLELAKLPAPLLMSDSDQRPTAVVGDLHWDIGYVYVMDGLPDQPPQHPAWTELRFVDVARISRKELVRAQDDVLRLAGMPCAD
jgi:ADP-ribose pyrophosphatase YjhB (NUDIX family)